MLQKKLKIIHIEDESDARITLNKMVEKFINNAEVISTASNLENGLKLVENETFDLLFLDLNLPDGDGFYIVEKHQNIASKTILTTADDTKGIKAVKNSVADYLVKPYSIRGLQMAIDKHLNKITLEKSISIKNKENRIAIPDINGVQIININNIIRLQSDGNYTYIILNNNQEKLYVSKTLMFFEKSLTGKGFIRIHRTHLINETFIYRVNKTNGGSVELVDGTSIKTSINGRKLLKEKFEL